MNKWSPTIMMNHPDTKEELRVTKPNSLKPRDTPRYILNWKTSEI